MPTDPDPLLIRALSAPDAATRRAALGALYDRYAEALLNVVGRFTGDWAAAEDVVQEVFLGLPERIGSFRGDSSLAAWLYRVALNRAIDLRRRAVRRPVARLDQLPDDELEGARRPLSGAPQEPEPRERDPRAAEVQAALLTLSPKLRAIAVLRHVEGLSYEQLAEVLGVSLGTVKSRLSRAHEALAKRLGDPAPGPRPGP